jgi:predicted dehydrogenase
MHLDGYRNHPERIRLVAACDPNDQNRERIRQDYGIERGFTTLEQMIEGADWEVGIVCTPTPVREDVVQTLARARKHVFVEKPLADGYDSAVRMVSACAEAGVRLAVDQNFRYHYPFDIARRFLREGRLGKVHGILHEDLMFRQDRGWRVECPRHALSVMGIHWLDGFRWMLEDRNAVSVTCRTHSSSAIECRGETDAHLLIAFEGGETATYVESFSSPLSRTETLVFGETGLLKLGYAGATFYSSQDRSHAEDLDANPYGGSRKPESTYRCLDELLTALEEDREPSNSGADNLKTIALLEAAYRSAERQQAVPLEEGRLL